MDLLTTKDVCNMLRISPNTLRNWRLANKFPEPIQVQNNNGKTLWLKINVENWINNFTSERCDKKMLEIPTCRIDCIRGFNDKCQAIFCEFFVPYTVFIKLGKDDISDELFEKYGSDAIYYIYNNDCTRINVNKSEVEEWVKKK